MFANFSGDFNLYMAGDFKFQGGQVRYVFELIAVIIVNLFSGRLKLK